MFEAHPWLVITLTLVHHPDYDLTDQTKKAHAHVRTLRS